MMHSKLQYSQTNIFPGFVPGSAMTKIRSLINAGLSAIVCLALLSSPASSAEPAAKDYAVVPVDAHAEKYNAELFNVVEKNGVMGDKNFDKDFAARFDRLLQESPVARNRSELKFLKKRLLSGPAPTPLYLAAFGKRYLYYKACQAHACNETHLSLLFDVGTKAMSGKLVVSGAPEILGKPSPQELELLEQLRPSN